MFGIWRMCWTCMQNRRIPRYPQVCFDESPVHLPAETRHPLPARPGQPAAGYDSEYKREGTANLFLFVQPLRGWRHVNVTHQRTKQDFAQQMRLLVDDYFPTAERIRAVVDNLNTHTPAALYSIFFRPEARRITRKLEFHYTPKHGSWLNMAECEFAVLAGQCLDRRIPNIDTLRAEIAAWQRPPQPVPDQNPLAVEIPRGPDQTQAPLSCRGTDRRSGQAKGGLLTYQNFCGSPLVMIIQISPRSPRRMGRA